MMMRGGEAGFQKRKIFTLHPATPEGTRVRRECEFCVAFLYLLLASWCEHKYTVFATSSNRKLLKTRETFDDRIDTLFQMKRTKRHNKTWTVHGVDSYSGDWLFYLFKICVTQSERTGLILCNLLRRSSIYLSNNI